MPIFIYWRALFYNEVHLKRNVCVFRRDLKEGAGVKYIAFWEFSPEDAAKAADKWERRKYKLKTLFPPHSLGGEPKGFTIFESEDEAEIMKYIQHYSPEMKIRIVPIFESSKAVELLKR